MELDVKVFKIQSYNTNSDRHKSGETIGLLNARSTVKHNFVKEAYPESPESNRESMNFNHQHKSNSIYSDNSVL